MLQTILRTGYNKSVSGSWSGGVMKNGELGKLSSTILLLVVLLGGMSVGSFFNKSTSNEKNIYAAMDDFSNFTCMTVNDSELGYPSILIRYYDETSTPSLRIRCRSKEVWFNQSLIIPKLVEG